MYRLKNFIKQNAGREFELKYAHRIINLSQMQFNHHTQMHFKHHTQRKHHAFQQAFFQHVHFIFINSKYRVAEVKYTRLLIL